MNGNKITGLKDPSFIYDASNKNYVDTQVALVKPNISNKTNGSTTGSSIVCSSDNNI
jgi:hypothetical protein